MFFTHFNFIVTYRPASKNTKADALSRQLEDPVHHETDENIIPEALLIALVQWDIMTEINQSNTQNPPPSDCPHDLTFVPEHLRERLLHQVHSTPSSGHPGITATHHLLTNRFWWPTMSTETATFVKNCTTCITSNVLPSTITHRSTSTHAYSSTSLVPYRH